jgi:alpha-glucosidase (family GH31 glycosyl hydrolase)
MAGRAIGGFLVLVGLGGLAAARVGPADDPARTLEIPFAQNERWWVGVVSESHRLPLDRDSAPFEIDLLGNTAGNQVQPLLVSTAGRYVWSEEPFALSIREGVIRASSKRGPILQGRRGTTLREAARHAARTFFPPSGRIPDPELFAKPQFNTWIELTYDQNQRDVLAYARAVVGNGFPPGVLMIDEGWAEGYGAWEFHRGRFPEPKAMMDELHRLGFKVMLWICPYIQPDGRDFTERLQDEAHVVWLRSAREPRWPALMHWWDGFSAVTDLTSPDGRAWLQAQLDHLVAAYGVDGFKFDGGDAEHYAPASMLTGSIAFDAGATPNGQTEAFARLGLRYPLNEYRACWKMGGQALAQRLRDKEHTWEDLRKLVPGILNQGLMGYPFACPDMIGGGEYLSFRDRAAVDQELVVRAAEVHALMPMMQFSVAPWRVLSPENLGICRRMARLHADEGPHILELAREAAVSGEPIARPLEYAWPGRGYADVVDEFLLGSDLLVAPVTRAGARGRRLVVPPGRWEGDDGSVVLGPTTIQIDVPLARLPRYRRVGGESEPPLNPRR